MATIHAKGNDLSTTETINVYVVDSNRAPSLNKLENITIKEGEILFSMLFLNLISKFDVIVFERTKTSKNGLLIRIVEEKHSGNIL